MKQTILLTFYLFLFSAIAHSQVLQTNARNVKLASFAWETDLCEYKGTYDSTKYSKKQLENTLHFTQLAGSVLLETDATVFNPVNISQLSMDKLTKEYTQKLQLYQSMPVVEVPFWEAFKFKILSALKEEYDLKKTTIEAYSNPKVLQGSNYATYCPEYVEALNTKDTALLFSAWKKLILLQSKKNANPKRIMDEFYQQYQSPDKKLFAKNHLMVFGWWNCANENLPHIASDEKLYQQFTKLFSVVTHRCDES